MKQNELAQEQNKFESKKAKGNLSSSDELKYKNRILKKEQEINKLNLKAIKAKEQVNKYSK